MLFLDYTQVKYCKLQENDQDISGIIYNDSVFTIAKSFPKEELEAAIKECREEYLDHEERSQIPTLLIKGKNSVGIWMKNSRYKSSDAATVSSSSRDQENPSNVSKIDLGGISLRQLASEMRSPTGVEIKTRRHKIKRYQSCFLGNEAVDWITKKVKVSRVDAIKLGQKMLEKGILNHVINEHQFKDDNLFYRFQDD